MIRLIIIIIITFGTVIAENGIEETQDAFALQKGLVYKNYKDHNSTVMCAFWLDNRIWYRVRRFGVNGLKGGSFDGNLCTHVIYRRLTLNPLRGTIIVTENYEIIPGLHSIIRKEYPHLIALGEIYLSLEDKSYQNEYQVLKHLLSTSEKQRDLITSIKNTIRELRLAGAHFTPEINFHYPDNEFIKFVKNLKQEFAKDGLLLTTEIEGFGPAEIDAYYSQVTTLSRIFDLVVVNGWNYETTNRSGYMAPLYSSEENNIEASLVNVVFKKMLRLDNLILQIPFTGRQYKMDDFAKASSEFRPNISHLKSLESSDYYEVCSSVSVDNKTWETYWDNISKVPFMKHENFYFTFENPKSVYEKVVFISKFGLRGVMVVDIDGDDFDGLCTNVTYPLLKTINFALAETKNQQGSQLCPVYEKVRNDHPSDYPTSKWRQQVVTLSSYSLAGTRNTKVEINCTVESESPRTIEWLKVNSTREYRLKSGGHNTYISTTRFDSPECIPYKKVTSTLLIRKMEARHAGKYVCSVASGFKLIQEECHLSCKNDCVETGESGEYTAGSLTWLWICMTIVALILFCSGNFVWFWRRRKIGLTEEEIVMFKSGGSDENDYSNDKNAQMLPYDADTYEIPDEGYQIDRKIIFGSGAFGIVYKGRIGDEVVAVKSTKPGCDKQYLKSLLLELKILMHLGRHPNIVSLLGAKTKHLTNGVVYIFVEYCPLGSLDSFLRKSRESFVPIDVDSRGFADIEENYSNCITTGHLLKWTGQVIEGLFHLRQKQVIHGDLAIRNILVADYDLVKITDFGLSRKQYNYSNYIKKSQEPLPWRWMALESLRDLSFSHQSDIWSLAITMWEIFSLAETPYPGMAYSFDFLQKLENGLRLDKPKHATPSIYTLMEQCWKLNPEERPRIDVVKEMFHQLKPTSLDRYVNAPGFQSPDTTNYENMPVRM